MSDTDTTLAMTAQSPRPSALGDLRFAGTIAAGLVAGTLGLGALAAPLVGWKNWPEGLGKDAASQPVRLASPVLHQPSNGARESGRGGGGNGGAPVQPGPGGAAPLLVSLPGGGTDGGGPLPLAPIGGPSTPRTSSGGGDDAGGLSTTARPRTGSGEFRGVPFAPVDVDDDDNDGLPNDWERRVAGTDANNAEDAAKPNAGGVTNAAQFRIMSLPGWDTNGNGIVDAEDDSDGDGIPNGIEERNGSDPASADTDGDGIPDTMDDRDGDGWPDGLPKPPEPPVEEPPVVEEPPTIATPEPTPTPEQTPPVEETPAPPVEETPAPTPAPVEETPAPPAEPTPTPEPTPTATPETQPTPEPTPPAATAASAPVEEAPVEETPAPTPAPVETPAAPAPTPEAPAASPAPTQQAPAATPAPTEQPAEDPAATPAW